MAERPPLGATFEVEAVGGRRRGARAVMLCVSGMAILIGVAVFGRLREGGSAGLAASPGFVAATPGAGAASTAIATPVPGPDTAGISLRSPGVGPITLTTAKLTVSGSVSLRSDHVEVALQGRNERTTAQAFVSVASAWDVFRPDESPTFRAVFDLRAPRRLGTMWVEITVYDAAGQVLASERRAFIVGPLKGA